MNTSPRSTSHSRRVVSAIVLMLLAAAFVLSSFGQGPLAPAGPPAPTMKTLDQLGTAIDQASSKIDALAAQGTVEKFTAVGRAFTENGTINCDSIEIARGRLVKVESIVVSTHSASTVTAHFRFSTRTGANDFQLLSQRIPLTSLSSDNTTTRTGSAQVPLWVRGGNSISDAQIGEAFNLVVCVDPPADESAAANFYVSGAYE